MFGVVEYRHELVKREIGNRPACLDIVNRHRMIGKTSKKRTDTIEAQLRNRYDVPVGTQDSLLEINHRAHCLGVDTG